MSKPSETNPVIATNRRARFDYEIEATYECGISLVGSEVKSLRLGLASLADAYAVARGGEVFLYGVHIPEYTHASMQNHEPTRVRKLLMHGREIQRLVVKTTQQGYTLVPVKIYFKGNLIKVELALARGKKQYDKRQSIAKRDAERDIAKRLGAVRRGG